MMSHLPKLGTVTIFVAQAVRWGALCQVRSVPSDAPFSLVGGSPKLDIEKKVWLRLSGGLPCAVKGAHAPWRG